MLSIIIDVTKVDEKEKDLSLIIAEKFPILKVILRPNDNYSGIKLISRSK